MSPAEVGWRVQSRVRSTWEARLAGRQRYVPLPSPRGPALRAELQASLAPLVPAARWREEAFARHPEATRSLLARARRIREGEIPIFARWLRLGETPDWHADPVEGTALPRRAAAFIDHRDRKGVGDARRAWELHRHHHLSEVALAAWLERDPGGADFAVRELLRWCDENPPLFGVAWTSGLEPAVRTLAWAQVLAASLDLQAPALDDAALERLVGAWVRQVEFVRAHDSRYSSANNHRIGEAAAVASAGCLLPFHRRAEAWWRWGKQVLEEEIERQIHADGVSREQAFGYQRFVLDFAFWVWCLARARGEELAAPARQRLERASRFLRAVTRSDGTLFPVGDDDEGRALSYGEELRERATATLAVAGCLFGRPEWRNRASARPGWLSLADPAPESGAAPPEPGAAPPESDAAVRASSPGAARLEAFREGGYVVVESERGGKLLLDAGPLGFGSLAAHGHADALSLLLWSGGEVLADAGTGSYHGEPEWREALRGTDAHNTAAVDGLDQSERRGPFLWGRRAESRLLAAGGDGGWFVIAASHDGYREAGVPLVRRLVLGSCQGEEWVLLVVDEFFGGGRHRLRVPWHAPAAEAELVAHAEGPYWAARFEGGRRLFGRAVLLAKTAAGPVVRSGLAALRKEEAWWSPRFGERRRQRRCVLVGEVSLPAASVWCLWLTAAPPAPGSEAPRLWPVAGGVAIAVGGAGGLGWRALVAHPDEAAVEVDGVRLEGRAAAWAESGPEALAGRTVVAGAMRLASPLFRWEATGAPLTGVLRLRPEVRSFENGVSGGRAT
jgi:hypothetical protein